METRDDGCPAVTQLFGREPSFDDLRNVGRWMYAASWLAEDRSTARALAEARFLLSADAASSAAKGAGRGDAERFILVSSLSRIRDSLKEGEVLAPSMNRAIEHEAAKLLAAGSALRAVTHRERSAFAQRFDLNGFEIGLRSTATDRNVFLREAAADLESSLSVARNPCPALRALRLFLRATLGLETHDASLGQGPGEPEGVVNTLGYWLAADLALTARRASAYGAAWTNAARGSGDAFSRIVAGLTSGSMMANGAVETVMADPFALLPALAMTVEPEHASAVLDLGAQAQYSIREQAREALTRWTAQARRADEMERKIDIGIVAPYEVREGYRDFGSVSGLDLFTAWYAIQASEEGCLSLKDAVERSLAMEIGRRRDAARKAKLNLERARHAFDAAVEAARERRGAADGSSFDPGDDVGAQRGCLYGFGAGCSVMATYVGVVIVVGTGGMVGKVAPLVVGVAALPIAAAIMVQIASALRRAARNAEAERQKAAAEADFERARALAERSHGLALLKARVAMEDAEDELAAFEQQVREAKAAA